MTPSTPASEPALSIGDVAAQTGVTVETLRYYEQRGLLRPVQRRSSGYRVYGADAVRVVRFIKRAQALGFSLAEIEELVQLRERAWTGDAPRQLRDAAEAKVRDISRRVRELRALGRELQELLAACDAGCTILEQTRGNSDGASVDGGGSCALVDAFDADVAVPAAGTSDSLPRPRGKTRTEKSRNGPPKPGRRIRRS
jgi:MerR family copper efflux transcriptional regulator